MSEPFRDNGTPLRFETYDTTSSDDQKWTFRKMEEGKVSIVHYRDGRVVDVNWWKLQEGQEVNTNLLFEWQLEKQRGQLWKIHYI